MKTSKLFSGLILIAILTLSSLLSNAQTLTAIEIVKKADEKNRGSSSQGEMSMSIIRPKWTRTVSMKVWTKGTDYAMIYITEPVKEKGQVFLKRKMEMWNWIPKISRVIKLPPSMMMQSWMGSDFTNDDLVKQSSIIVDYTHKIIGSETIDGYDCYKIELIPKEDAAISWGKLILWISKKDFFELKIEFYDEDEFLVNTQTASDIKQMNDRKIPTRMEIIPEDKDDNKTVLIIKNMTFNKPIDDNFFSQQNMKRIR